MAVVVNIVKKATDPVTTRVSIGGSSEIGYYCTYRGTKEEAISAIEMVLISMKAMAQQLGPNKEPDISPDDGKKYA